MKTSKVLLLVMLCCFVCSCGNTEDKSYASALKRLRTMKSYTCDVIMKKSGNNSTRKYLMKHYYLKDKKYRVEISEPEEFKGQYIIYNEGKVAIYNPVSKHKLIRQTNTDNEYQSVQGALSVYAEYAQKAEYSKQEIAGKKYYIMKCTIPRDNEYLKADKLFINSDTGIPEKIEIYDSKGTLNVEILFNNFKMNSKINENLFEIKD